MTGRTSWWPCDSAEHDRELIVELGEEFGPAGPYVVRVLKDLAQQQREDGRVRTGFRVLRAKTFAESTGQVREIVERAGAIGALDELEIDPDGRRFTCRISGWAADSRRGTEAIRKAHQRRDTSDLSGTESHPNGTNTSVVPPERDVSHIDNHRGKGSSEPLSSRTDLTGQGTKVSELFAYWQQQCGHGHAKLTPDRKQKIAARLREGYTPEQIRQAIDGAARAAYVDDAGKRHDDLTLICRTGSKLEDFIERARVRQPHDEAALIAKAIR